MIKHGNFNFVAGADVDAHKALTIDTTNSSAHGIAVKHAGSTDGVVGFAGCDTKAGEVVNFVKIEFGQVCMAVAGGAISAGAQLGLSSGKVVTGGALPLFAIDAASADGDLIRVICAADHDNT